MRRQQSQPVQVQREHSDDDCTSSTVRKIIMTHFVHFSVITHDCVQAVDFLNIHLD